MRIGQDDVIEPKGRNNPDKNGGGKETANLIKYEVIFSKRHELRVLEL